MSYYVFNLKDWNNSLHQNQHCSIEFHLILMEGGSGLQTFRGNSRVVDPKGPLSEPTFLVGVWGPKPFFAKNWQFLWNIWPKKLNFICRNYYCNWWKNKYWKIWISAKLLVKVWYCQKSRTEIWPIFYSRGGFLANHST